jgi:hypothetical protein
MACFSIICAQTFKRYSMYRKSKTTQPLHPKEPRNCWLCQKSISAKICECSHRKAFFLFCFLLMQNKISDWFLNRLELQNSQIRFKTKLWAEIHQALQSCFSFQIKDQVERGQILANLSPGFEIITSRLV